MQQKRKHYFDNSLKQYETEEEKSFYFYNNYATHFNIIWSDSLPLEYEIKGFIYFKNVSTYEGDIRQEDTITERIPAPKQEEFQRYNNPNEYRYFIKYYINDFMESLEDYQKAIKEAAERNEIIYPKRYIYDYKTKGKAGKVKTQAEQLDPHNLKEYFSDLEILSLNHLNETENYEFVILPHLKQILTPAGIGILREIYFHDFTDELRADKEEPEAYFFRNLPANLPIILNNPEINNYTALIKYKIKSYTAYTNELDERIKKAIINISFICGMCGKDFEVFKDEARTFKHTELKGLNAEEIKDKLEPFKNQEGTIEQALYIYFVDFDPIRGPFTINRAALENHKRILQNITTEEIAHNPAFVFPGTDEHRKEIDLIVKGFYDKLIPEIKRNPQAVEYTTERGKNNHLEPTDPITSRLTNLWFYFDEPTPDEIKTYEIATLEMNQSKQDQEETKAIIKGLEEQIAAMNKERAIRDLTPGEEAQIKDLEEQKETAEKYLNDQTKIFNSKRRARNKTQIIYFINNPATPGIESKGIYKKIIYCPLINNAEDDLNSVFITCDYFIMSIPKYISIINRDNDSPQTTYIKIYERITESKTDIINSFFSFIKSRLLAKGGNIITNVYITQSDILKILGVRDSGHMANYRNDFEFFWINFFQSITFENISFKDKTRNWIDHPDKLKLISKNNGYNEFENLSVTPGDLYQLTQNTFNMTAYVSDQKDDLTPQAKPIFDEMKRKIKINEAKGELNAEIFLNDIRDISRPLTSINYKFNGKNNDRAGKKWIEILTDIGDNKGILFQEFRQYENNGAFRNPKILTIQEGYNLLTSYKIREDEKRHDLNFISLVIATDPEQHPSQKKLIERINKQNRITKKDQKKLKGLQDKQLKEGK